MRKIFLILCVLVSVAVIKTGSVTAQPEKIRVMVEVVGDQKVDRQTQKYMKKGLSFIRDVEAVKRDPEVYVHVIVRKLVTSSGKEIGFVMSSASSEILDLVVDEKYPLTLSDYSGLWLEVGPDLSKLCERCITAIDTSILNMVREGKGVQ